MGSGSKKISRKAPDLPSFEFWSSLSKASLSVALEVLW